MLEWRSVKKIDGERMVLDIPELTVAAGQIVAIVGPAGSGLDELFELLLGNQQPTTGTIRLDGLNPTTDRDAYRRRLGVLFATNNLYVRNSALSNLRLHAQLYGLPRKRADEVIAWVGLGDVDREPVAKLSSGMQRRLAFGRATLHHPNLLALMDPFAECDRASIDLLQDLCEKTAQQGTAVLILTDDLSNLSFCNTIHILQQGCISDSYSPEQPSQTQIPFKIPARSEDKVVLLNPSDILFALAEEGRAWVQTCEQRLPTQFTLTKLEERLARSGFFRAHRSFLVNLQHVREVIPYTRNSYTLVLDGEQHTEIPLSKSAARELRELLGY